MKKHLLDSAICTVIVFLSMLVFIMFIDYFTFLKPFKQSFADMKITDTIFSKLYDPNSTYNDDIILINRGNLSKFDLAGLLTFVAQFEPKAIGLIKEIEEESDPEMKIADEYLAMTLEQIDNVVIPSRLKYAEESLDEIDTIEYAPQYFSGSAINGYSNFYILDKQYYMTRSFMPTVSFRDSVFESFAVKTARLFDSAKTARFLEANQSKTTINYIGTQKNFMKIEGFEIIKYQFPLDFIKGNIVLIGKFQEGGSHICEEMYFTPLNSDITGRTFPDMYPIEIQANIISMILKENYFYTLPTWINIAAAVLLCYLNILLYSYITDKNKKLYEISSLALFVIESLAILTLTYFMFKLYRTELELTLSIFAIALSGLAFEAYEESIKPLTSKLFYK